ncbi:L-rhamnose-binding lectin CSL1-like isoform X2 [Corythoichthys intestinalis]|nr:L-rhamnose-binding lectin CSL1-like isoform X2 [Corythoichthys intestinalis]
MKPELKCPSGFAIFVEKVDVGLKKDADCSARNKAAAAVISEISFIHLALFTGLINVCENEELCLLPENILPELFIQISYSCVEKPKDLVKTIVCDGKSENLKCDVGVLGILDVKYGRVDEKTCTDTPSAMTSCRSVIADDIINALCQGEKECTLEADPSILGVPFACDDLPKYLQVQYICVDMKI